MSYSSNPLLPKAIAEALRLVLEQGLPLNVTARKSGIHRTTLWRWKRKWEALNRHVQLENEDRPHHKPGAVFRQSALTCAFRRIALDHGPAPMPWARR